MSFSTDQQTITDLNIFGGRGQNSIFEMFNRTRTRGGAAILGEMFRSPLSHEREINARIAIIAYLTQSLDRFPISIDHFDPVESYIKITDSRTKLSTQADSLAARLNNLVAVDADTALIYHGISAMIKLLKELNDFLKIQKPEPEHPFFAKVSEISAILARPDFTRLLDIPPNGKILPQQFLAYDEFLRFQSRDQILVILEFVYQLDVYFAVGKIAKDRNFVFPKALAADHHLINVQGVFHPLVERAVANSIIMTIDRNVVFLTGANMAGKSTLMKSLSTALFLAHMGFPVPASFMEFSVLDGIYTTINLPDDLGMGASHFYAEVLRVKKIATELKLGKNLFVLFDEMFRGTNVKDASEATIAFTQAFGLKHNSMFVISTHIIEAGEVLMKRCKNINFLYLPTTMQGTDPIYSYKVAQGLTADRHGLIIIMNEGIIKILESGLEQNKNT